MMVQYSEKWMWMARQLDVHWVPLLWMVSQKVALKAVLISKVLHCHTVLVSMIMWVDWMADNLEQNFELGLDLAVVMTNHLWMGS